MIPAEIGVPTPQITSFEPPNNEEEVYLNLEFVEEKRELVAISDAKYKQKMKQYYIKR